MNVFHLQQFSVASTPEFYIQWDEGISGKVSKTGDLKAMCDFALQLTTLVEAGEMTGYSCDVRRELDGDVRYTKQNKIKLSF